MGRSDSVRMVNGEVNTDNEKPEISISLISQYLYCKRRAALITLYDEWADNEHTVSGTLEHERVHEAGMFGDGARKTYHGLSVQSARLGLIGVCDRVDFELDSRNYIPIECKHGKRRNGISFEAQLCAQAICLEEMFDCDISIGYLYFFSEKRRKEVMISEDLRKKTMEAVSGIRKMICDETMPRAEYSAKCRGCSLHEICVPKSPRGTQATAYIERILNFARGGEDL